MEQFLPSLVCGGNAGRMKAQCLGKAKILPNISLL